MAFDLKKVILQTVSTVFTAIDIAGAINIVYWTTVITAISWYDVLLSTSFAVINNLLVYYFQQV
jgi:hypothetical protein